VVERVDAAVGLADPAYGDRNGGAIGHASGYFGSTRPRAAAKSSSRYSVSMFW